MTITEREAFISFVSRIVKEGGLILLIASCCFLLLSLMSFDARDPGWSHLGYDGAVRNLAGVAGAWMADFCYSGLGFFAFAPPIMLAYRSTLFLRKRDESFVKAMPYFTLRLLGALLFIFAGAALASLHFSNQWLQLPFGAGGMFGLSGSDAALGLFGLIGSTCLLLALWMLGLTLFADLSWFQLADWLGQKMLEFWNLCKQQLPVKQEKSAVAANAASDHFVEETDDRDLSVESEKGLPWSLFDRGEKVLPADATIQEPEFIEDFSEAEPAYHASEAIIDPVKDTPPVPDNAPANMPASSVGEKHVKIVPLSESMQPQPNDDEASAVSAKLTVPRLLGKKRIPSIKLLDKAESKTDLGFSPEVLESMSRLLEAKLKDFGVVAEVVEVNPGPVITRFEIQPSPGTKVSKISNLAKDLARSMAVLSVRVVEVIAGKSVVGIEIPNEDRETVRLSEVLGSGSYDRAESKLSLGLGNDIAGNPVVVNLAKMPHLLVAGTTGSGKSVGVNAMLLSLLFKATPDEVRLMMVDPKMLELSIYDGIPHLLTPVITDMKEAASGLRWCVAEMERRYRLMAKMGVRNLQGFNDKVRAARDAGQPLVDPLWNPLEEGFDENAPAPELETLPYIVVVIDEFADMMMIVGKKVEELIARIAQKARAAGIHLILATQRPSVDVITGLIKANVPTRIAFQVSSKIDSRTILDQSGAEHLLGYGDMLYLPAGTSMPIRVHGAFVADDEVHRVVEAWKKWGPAEFVEEILQAQVDADLTVGTTGSLFEEEQDALYDEAVAFVTQSRRASISAVQRKLKIGYNRAARMVESMEAAGVVSEAGHNGSREVLAPPPVQ
ncbi:MAG: DNA translocase FtsK 4TM domain-containing protein [Motiliproteus sp.]|nr:DNA translocase FtsK 4TM domain-containing protein [Motiliproteus sp.]